MLLCNDQHFGANERLDPVPGGLPTGPIDCSDGDPPRALAGPPRGRPSEGGATCSGGRRLAAGGALPARASGPTRDTGSRKGGGGGSPDCWADWAQIDPERRWGCWLCWGWQALACQRPRGREQPKVRSLCFAPSAIIRAITRKIFVIALCNRLGEELRLGLQEELEGLTSGADRRRLLEVVVRDAAQEPL